jgi:hypothetical protein
MRISHRYKFIYYSIPKTGSESVRQLLDPLSDVKIVAYSQITSKQPFYSHMRPVEVNRVFKTLNYDISKYFSFATVRNPWKRMASLFYMIQRNQRYFWNGSFKDWLKSIDSDKLIFPPTNGKWYDHGIINYSTFLKCGASEKGADQIFRIEDGLSALIRQLTTRKDIKNWEPEILHINKNPETIKYKELYDTQSTEIVGQLFSKDIAIYGYSFDD